MKKTSIELFELIHSLTMAEKKYFKMFSSMKGGDKNYLKLYDAMEKQHRYNEDAIRTAYSGQKFLRQLFATKNRLYNNILRSLENYHSGADVNLHSQLRKAGILLRKGLTAHALKLLKTTKAIAYQHEQWELLMEILDMERIPYATLDTLKIPRLNEESKAVLQKLSNINDYQAIHHKMIQRIQEAGPMRTKKELSRIEKLMQHPLLRNSKQASCTEAKAYYYEIWSLCYFFKRDFIKGLETAKEQCDFLETHFHQLKDPEKKHLFALNISTIFMGHLLSAKRHFDKKQKIDIRSGKYGEREDVLQKIRSYPIIPSLLKAEYWTHSYINELNGYRMEGAFEKVFPALKAIDENHILLNQAASVTKNNLYYNIAYMLFGAGSYNEALRWIIKIIDHPIELRKDTQALAHILYLLINYELHKDEQMLDSLERRTRHFLSTRHRIFKVEKALMHCLRQIMGKPVSRKERTLAFQELKTTLLKLMKNPMEKAAIDEFDFLSWVESKIQNKTFAEVVREKAK
ncbi:MAG: hypothetical protein HY840_07510 [Bacteroidetes bacterium]|nr:hypothetical protein [Bacteroidota bacterium]